MEKGFTLKSVLIVGGLIIAMVFIAFFVSKKEESPPDQNDEYEEETEELLEIDNGEEELNYEPEEIIEESNTESEEEQEDYGDLDPMITAAKNDLAKRLNRDIQEITVGSITEVIFSDHTLGTSNPGEIYPQTPTPGYVIILTTESRQYRYHADKDSVIYINEITG